MGIFLGQALKSGQGETPWRDFFVKASAALACIEKCPPVPGFETRSEREIFEDVAEAESQLHVLNKLRSFAIAADNITTNRGQGHYHLIILNSQRRTVSIIPYSTARLAEATTAYAEVEARTRNGEPIEAVLVSAGPIEALRRAYPNYFLDTQEFIQEIDKVIEESKTPKRAGKEVARRRKGR